MIFQMMNRIRNARLTAIRANNPWFKNYWNEVADKLEADLILRYG